MKNLLRMLILFCGLAFAACGDDDDGGGNPDARTNDAKSVG